MSLAPCPDCGAMISRRAPDCPRCGAPLAPPDTLGLWGILWACVRGALEGVALAVAALLVLILLVWIS